MNLTHLPPVTRDAMGFIMFLHPNGRVSASVKVNGQRHYARDYKDQAVAIGQDDDALVEPGDREFIAALERQWERR